MPAKTSPSGGFDPCPPSAPSDMVTAPAMAAARATRNRARGRSRNSHQPTRVTTTGVRLVRVVALATEVRAML